MKTLTALTLMLVPAVAFAGGGGYTPGQSPVKLEKIAGSELKSVTLTGKAAERAGVETVLVREGTVARKWKLGGMIMPPAAKALASRVDGAAADSVAVSEKRGVVGSTKYAGGFPGDLLVSIAVSPSELRSVAAHEPARIRALSRGAKKSWVIAKPIDKMPVNGDQPRVNLHYAVAGTGHGLVPGQRVSVELNRVGADKPQKIVPYSSVLYDVRGNTWVYTNPKPLVFVRHAIKVDFIEGDSAILTDGPAIGTKVVSVGAPELFGAETGIK